MQHLFRFIVGGRKLQRFSHIWNGACLRPNIVNRICDSDACIRRVRCSRKYLAIRKEYTNIIPCPSKYPNISDTILRLVSHVRAVPQKIVPHFEWKHPAS